MKYLGAAFLSFFVFFIGSQVYAENYFTVLKDIKNTYKSRKLLKALVSQEDISDSWIIKNGVTHDNDRMKVLIDKLIPWFKNDDIDKIITEMEQETDSFSDLAETLIEYSYNSDLKKKSEILQRLYKIKNFTGDITEILPSKDRISGLMYYNSFYYTKAIEYFIKEMPFYTDYAQTDPKWQIYLKYFYFALGISYVYKDYGNELKDKIKREADYIKAREAFVNAMNVYPELATYFIPVCYTFIGRTWFYETNYEKALENYDIAIKKSIEFSGKTYPDAESSYAEILTIQGEYEKALEKINWVIEYGAAVDASSPTIPNDIQYDISPDGLCCAYYNKALICKNSGDEEQAEFNLQAALTNSLWKAKDRKGISPSIIEYKNYYNRKCKEFYSLLPVGVFITPKPVFINAEDTIKVTAKIRIENGKYENPEFKSENPEIFEIVSVTENKANYSVTADLLGKKFGKSKIIFTATINNEQVKREAEVSVYDIKYYSKKGEEFSKISELLPASIGVNKGLPVGIDMEQEHIATIKLYSSFVTLYYKFRYLGSMEKIELSRDYSKPDYYADNTGYSLQVFSSDIPTSSKSKDVWKKFKITVPKKHNLFKKNMFEIQLKLAGTDQYNREIYSNMIYENFLHQPPILSESSSFKIRMNIVSGKEKAEPKKVEYLTDIHIEAGTSGYIDFNYVGNDIWESVDLFLVKNGVEYDITTAIPIVYKTDPTITLKLGENNHKMYPAKGAYAGCANFDAGTFDIIKGAKAENALGYNVIQDFSVTPLEMFNDIKKCSIMYLRAHGLVIAGTTEEFVSLCVLSSLADKEGIEIDSSSEFPKDIAFDVVYFEACGSLAINKPLFNNVIKKFNSKVYIGWTNVVALIDQARDFSYRFFTACKAQHGTNPQIPTVHEAFKLAKKQYLIELKTAPPMTYFYTTEENYSLVDERLSIYPEESVNVKIDLKKIIK